MKTYLIRGEETKNPFQQIKFRCVTEKDMDFILKKLKLKRTEIKINCELSLDNPYNVEWRGLPEFKNIEDKWEYLKIKFTTEEDKKEFYELIGLPYTKKGYEWYPSKPKYLPNTAYWDSDIPKEQQKNKYPIFVISKGRYENRRTSDYLSKCKIEHILVVEYCEKELYRKDLKEHVWLMVMEKEFDNLGEGSIPVRNWVDRRAKDMMVERYWCLDDNIDGFCRFYKNTRVEIRTPLFFKLTEVFADRYENLYLCGLQYKSFLPEISKRRWVVQLNTRVYSCMLISTKLKDKLDGVLWRGRYNEDTDISLRLLKKGFPTCLLDIFLCDKQTTMSCEGGNTDTIYKDDGLQKKLDSLISQHPDCVKGTIKFKKIHHQVNYKPFNNNKLILKKDIIIPDDYYDWGLRVRIDGF